MSPNEQFITASEASKRLGVSTKALRLYEERRLIMPVRTEAGWRAYGPNDISRAVQIKAFRGLGLSLGQIARVLDGDAQELDRALATHLASLSKQASQLDETMERISTMRAELAAGRADAAAKLVDLIDPDSTLEIAFHLPWPWGGERYELRSISPLNFITGPLGSGKTRLARKIAETLPNGIFLSSEHSTNDVPTLTRRPDANSDHQCRVDQAIAWLLDEGANDTDALHDLVVELEADATAGLVIDMPEHKMDEAAQNAIAAYLRRSKQSHRPLFVLTRSSAILDLTLVGRDEAIIYCPANHNPPMMVEPFEGTPGYESVATCLAAPDVRARTEGVMALQPLTAV